MSVEHLFAFTYKREFCVFFREILCGRVSQGRSVLCSTNEISGIEMCVFYEQRVCQRNFGRPNFDIEYSFSVFPRSSNLCTPGEFFSTGDFGFKKPPVNLIGHYEFRFLRVFVARATSYASYARNMTVTWVL